MLIKLLRISSRKKSFAFPTVLVIDFPLQTAGINALSSFLADDLSAALDAKLPAGTRIPRSKLHEFLVAQDVSPLNLQSVFIVFWATDNSEQTKSSPGKCRLLTKHST
jgi:hypothetical protein